MERGRYMYKILASLLATFVLALVLTPLVRRLSFRIGAVDNPNARRAKIQINVIGKLNQPRETTPRNGKVKVVILILAIK